MADTGISFGAVDLSGANYGVLVERMDLGLLSPVMLRSGSYAQAHGGHVSGSFLESAVLEIPVVIKGSSHADLLSKIDAVKGALAPGQGDQAIALGWLPGRYRLGRWAGDLKLKSYGAMAARGVLKFVCADPRWYGETLEDLDGSSDDDPYEFNVPGSGVIAGNLRARPVWILVNEEVSASGEVVLRNTTTGQAVSVTGIGGGAGGVRLDCARQLIEYTEEFVDLETTVWTPAMDMRTGEVEIPELEPGVVNVMELEGLGVGYWYVEWRGVWM